MEKRLEEFIEELGNAVEEAAANSARIRAALAEIKRTGYEVSLDLEAKVTIRTREPDR